MAPLTLRLVCSNNKIVLKIDDSETTEALYKLAREKVGSLTQLSAGFPPKVIPEDGQTIKDAGIINQDTLRGLVEAPAVPEPTASAPKAKRKAAQKATESFAETIKAQDALERETSPKKRSSTTISRPSQNRVNRAVFNQSQGRRLQDGHVVSPRKRPKTQTSTEDPSLALLGTLEDKSKGARLLRKGWKNAVMNAYEQNQAVARLSDPNIQFIKEGSDLKVTYSKGVQGRGSYEESVLFIPRDVLESVVANIYPSNKEALRPENLALLSPRVLFCIMYHCQGHPEEGLKQLQPDLDWSFLKRRQRTLSAKARENLRQQQENDEDMEAAAAAIESVEIAMANLGSLSSKNETQTKSHWRLTTPSEEDRKELRDCIETNPINDTDKIIDQLIQNGIHNWRELANVGELPDFDDKAISWIDKAREESLGEIIVEICDGDLDAVDLLSEIKCGTVKDLSVWATIPECLFEELEQNDKCPSIEQLTEWTQRAVNVLEDYPWVRLYTTPVD